MIYIIVHTYMLHNMYIYIYIEYHHSYQYVFFPCVKIYMCASLDIQAFFPWQEMFQTAGFSESWIMFQRSCNWKPRKTKPPVSFIWWSPQVADLASWCCAANQVGCRSHRCGAHVDVDEVVCPARGAKGWIFRDKLCSLIYLRISLPAIK